MSGNRRSTRPATSAARSADPRNRRLLALAALLLLGLTLLVVTPPARAADPAKATFAGGCFWCVESDFDKVAGVLSTTSGYIGGTVANPTYNQVAAKKTGHAEAVEITFDPARVSYQQLLEVFWRSIDPTTVDRQFCDVGSPYRTAIFTHDGAQLAAARASLQALEKNKPFKEPIVTQIQPATTFYPAEDYHQDYYQKNPVRYRYYRFGCGRDARLKELWGNDAPKH
ncbi:MAG TPA: peptide-methionine (S)-S-oxide reductase MsrA [Armatimonadota bacterium]|nr:peptide-methionine (S)-S-oxide reductase MsrA [Armatimonadota bacterium]